MSTILKTGWRYFVVTTFTLSVASASVSLHLLHSHTAQWEDFMEGRRLYADTLQYDQALSAFTRSLHDYKEAMSMGYDPFKGRPSLEMAELALHMKALAEIKMNTDAKNKDALDDLNLSLTMTVKDSLDQAEADGRLDPKLRSKIENDRNDDQVNIEILQNNQPKLAKGQGKGKGSPQDGDGQKTDDPANPGGNAAGKPSREEL